MHTHTVTRARIQTAKKANVPVVDMDSDFETESTTHIRTGRRFEELCRFEFNSAQRTHLASRVADLLPECVCVNVYALG